MGTLGEDLKAAREKKGMSLHDAAEKTRISSVFLQALEEGDYSRIPGEVFVSGFLRSYAKEIGLNPKEVLARYKESVGALPQDAAQPQPDAKMSQPEPSHVSPFYMYAAVAVILVAAAWGIIAFLGEDETPPEPPPAIMLEVPPVMQAVTSFANTSGMQPASGPDDMVGGFGVRTTVPLPTHKINLRLTAIDNTWYSYSIDGREGRVNGFLAPGRSMDIRADQKVMLVVGNAGGVGMELNGKKLEPFGPKGAPRTLMFTPDKPPVLLGTEKNTDTSKSPEKKNP